MACGRLAKDVQYLQRHIDAQTNGQAQVTEVDDNLEFLLLNFTPNDGYYRGAKLRFKIGLDTNLYPDEVPQVVCLDNVYHPNIDTSEDGSEEGSSNVCVSLLDEWDPSMGLDHVVMAVLFLLYNPNPEDALSPYFDGSMEADDLEENIRRTLSGETVEGISWPRLLLEDAENGAGEGSEPGQSGLEESSLAAVNVTPTNPDSQAGGDGDSPGEPLSTNMDDETSEESASTKSMAATHSSPSLESELAKEGKDSEDKDLSSLSSSGGSTVSKMSPLDSLMINCQTSVLSLPDVIAQALKASPVIRVDAADERRTPDSGGKCYGDSAGIGRLFSCTGCRVSRIKALFSCFHRRDAGLAAVQFPGTDAGILGDGGDCCDVD